MPILSTGKGYIGKAPTPLKTAKALTPAVIPAISIPATYKQQNLAAMNPYPVTPTPVYNTTNSFVPAPAPAISYAQSQQMAPAPVVQSSGGGDGGGATAAPAPAQAPEPVYQAPAAAPVYVAPEINIDLSGIWETAGQMADNEINPQLSQIDQLLQEAGYSADESQRAINEAYPVARRSLQKSIYENMAAGEGGLAAMGTGRGGGRQELLARAGERTATGLETIETGKQRETGAIQRALASYKGTLGTQKTALAGQRGGLQATYSEQLRGSRFNEAATQANLGLNYANLNASTRQANANLVEQARQYNATLAQNASQFGESLGLSKEQLAQNADQFGATLGENTRQFDINNTPLPGASGSATGYANTSGSTGGLNYFLNDSDLAALGLGNKVNTAANAVGTASIGATGTTAIQAGKPKTLKYTGNGMPYYG